MIKVLALFQHPHEEQEVKSAFLKTSILKKPLLAVLQMNIAINQEGFYVKSKNYYKKSACYKKTTWQHYFLALSINLMLNLLSQSKQLSINNRKFFN